MTEKKISSIPCYRDMIASVVREEGEYPKKHIYSLFEYPDCFRKYDGSNWTVIKKEAGEDLATFEATLEGK